MSDPTCEHISLHGRQLLNRRGFLHQAGMSMGALSLTQLLAEDAAHTPIRPEIDAGKPYAPRGAHHAAAAKQDLTVSFMQSNAEDGIIAAIHAARNDGTEAIIINAAAFTHTSVAIRDAIQMFSGIRIEVHLSNIFAREPFRHHSYLSDIAQGIICGLGADGYHFAMDAAIGRLCS